MKIRLIVSIGVVFSFSLAYQEMNQEKIEDVHQIVDKNCSLSGCHQGNSPPKGLNLEKDVFLDSVLNIPSQEVPSLKLVDTKNPEKSYLLMKIKGSRGIKGARMPAYSPPLSSKEIQTVQEWINSLKRPEKGARQKPLFALN